MSYDSVLYHLIMLQDRLRTGAYAQAIAEVVQQGDRVLDFGCGTGVLSVFAERAGAAQVIALEKSPMLRAAKAIFERNGCHRVETIAGDGATASLPNDVDLIVSEWMGDFLFAEPAFAPLLSMRDRHLAPGGRMLPATCTLHVGLVTEADFRTKLTFFQDKPYGIDFSTIAEWPLCEVQPVSATSADVLAATACVGTLDMRTVTGVPKHLEGELVPERDASAVAMLGWFDAQLSPQVTLSTGPHAPKTHWCQLLFPFRTPLDVRKGEPVKIEVQPVELGKQLGYVWQASTARASQGGDNLIHQAWLRGTGG